MSCSHAKRYRSPTVPTLAFFFRWHPRSWITRDKMFQIDNVFSGWHEAIGSCKERYPTHMRDGGPSQPPRVSSFFQLEKSRLKIPEDTTMIQIRTPAVDIVPPVSRLALPSWQTKLCRLNSFGLLLCGSEAVVSERRQILL